MSDEIDRAEVLIHNTIFARGRENARTSPIAAARALADAGLLVTPAHDAAVAAKALREAADEVYGDARFAGQYWHTLSAASWLRERAGHIEREGGAR